VTDARAILRWAGGKSWLTRRLGRQLRATEFRTYHEPFLGGGSVFFAVAAERIARLSDRNADLIEAYRAIQTDVEGVITCLEGFRNTEQFYYEVRSSAPAAPTERAARFIFLNQTSFNGIYRVNLRGQYNVPYGGKSKRFLDADALRSASRALRNAELTVCDFADTLPLVSEGDLVFLDPSYTVSHNLNGFLKYNQHLFSLEDQHRLAAYVRKIKEA
jgi:DNA adenine methylase